MKWTIDYLTSDGDLVHCWIEALSKDEAIEKARQEYWDIDTIIQVRK